MKAMIWTQYGSPDVLQLQEVEKPEPRDNEVLIKIYGASVTAGDCEIRSLDLPFLFRIPIRIYAGIKKPNRIKILGQELSGKIESVGKDVKLFKVGDEIFASTGFNMGAYGEYICLPEKTEESAMAIKPVNMTYEEAAVIPVGGFEALHFLRQAHIKEGQKILINGAGGSIGTIAIQLASSYGAEVTAVDSTEKLEMMKSIGAHRVIDYTKDDFTKAGETYDVIFDIVGKSSFFSSLKILNKKGFYLIGNASLSLMLRKLWLTFISSKKIIVGTSSHKVEDLLEIKNLIETNKIKAVIDRNYALDDVAQAHLYVETGKKKGSVVIAVVHE
jgi:NADPH:quinone reductase-like Zn-dependent oxidoreductase